MKKLGIIMAILLHVIVGFAQRSITVGAKIETDFQIWYLDSIVLSNDSTTLKWHVVSKGDTWASESLYPSLIDPSTMKQYHMKHVWGIAKEPDKTILKPGEVRSFITTFPRISKSTKLLNYDDNDNNNFWVTGINLKKGGYSKSAPYIPARKSVFFSNDSIKKKNSWKQLSVEEQQKMLNLSEKMFDLGMSAYGRGKYQDAIEIFSKVSDIDSIVYIGMGDGKFTSAPYLEPKRPYFSNYSKMWIASCYHRLGKDSLALCSSHAALHISLWRYRNPTSHDKHCCAGVLNVSMEDIEKWWNVVDFLNFENNGHFQPIRLDENTLDKAIKQICQQYI